VKTFGAIIPLISTLCDHNLTHGTTIPI